MPIFDHMTTEKLLIFNFLEFASACKNQLNSYIHCCKTVDFRIPWVKGGYTHFWSRQPNSISYQLLAITIKKNQFTPLIALWDIASLKFVWPGRTHPFLTTPNPILFYQLLISGLNMQWTWEHQYHFKFLQNLFCHLQLCYVL